MTPEASVENALAELFRMSKARFGNAVKGYWFCDEDACPGCDRPIDSTEIKEKNLIAAYERYRKSLPA